MQVHTSSRQHMRREMLGEIVRQPHRVATFDNDDFALSNGCHGHVYCCIGIGASARGRLSVSSRIKSPQDRKSVVSGKSVSVRVALGGRRIIKKKIKQHTYIDQTEPKK